MQWRPVHSTRTASSTHPWSAQKRFHGGGGRPVFGLWATYFVAASHLIRESALACATQQFVPITAAGQRRIYTSFPFNKPQSGPDLHITILKVSIEDDRESL